MRARAEKNGYKNGTKFGSLTSQIKYDERLTDMWPTPAARDWKGKTNPGVVKVGSGCIYGETLPEKVDRMLKDGMLPTPTAIEGVKWTNTWNPNSQMGQILSAMAGSGMLPTPICSDGEAGGCAAIRKDTGKQRMDCLRHFVACITTELDENGNPKYAERDGGASRLSPLFTEEMMGFPFLWTALPFLSQSGAPKPSKPTATPSSPK